MVPCARPALLEGFFCCNLLTPEEPPHHSCATYVGCTVSPVRRLLEHDRFQAGGAAATEGHLPW
jgi:hypothetical protein